MLLKNLTLCIFVKQKGPFCSFCLFVVNVVVVFFLPWHSRVEQFALTLDNLIENSKSLRNAEVFASYLKCCRAITEKTETDPRKRNPFARTFLHECFLATFANFTFSHPKYFEHALPLFLFVHSTIVRRIRGNVMLHCLC